MKSALDSSVIVAALCEGDPDHAACRKLLLSGRHSVLAHAFAETFSTLTCGAISGQTRHPLIRRHPEPQGGATSTGGFELGC